MIKDGARKHGSSSLTMVASLFLLSVTVSLQGCENPVFAELGKQTLLGLWSNPSEDTMYWPHARSYDFSYESTSGYDGTFKYYDENTAPWSWRSVPFTIDDVRVEPDGRYFKIRAHYAPDYYALIRISGGGDLFEVNWTSGPYATAIDPSSLYYQKLFKQ